MSWSITREGRVSVVRMSSGKVNKMNPDFFRELHQTFDHIERDSPKPRIVLTGTGQVFSAGLDFEHVFPLFARGNIEEVTRWFKEFRAMLVRVYACPHPTVAAVNGHAFAGGLILALCCDFRIAALGDLKFSINEVPVGIPMPSVYLEIVRSRVGSAVTHAATLTGKVYSAREALQAGFIDSQVSPERLLEESIRQADAMADDCLAAYAQSKKMLLAPVMRWIDTVAEGLDETTLKVLISPESLKAQAQALQQLKARKS